MRERYVYEWWVVVVVVVVMVVVVMVVVVVVRCADLCLCCDESRLLLCRARSNGRG